MNSLSILFLSLFFIFISAQTEPSCPFSLHVSRFDIEASSFSTNSITWSLQEILSEKDGHTLNLTPTMVRKFKVRPDFKFPYGPIPEELLNKAELILEMSGWSSVDMVDMRVKVVFPKERTDDLNFVYHFHVNSTYQWRLLGSLKDFLSEESMIELSLIAKNDATFYLDSLHLVSRFHQSNSDEEMAFASLQTTVDRTSPGTYDVTVMSDFNFLGFNYASYWNGVDENQWWPLPVDPSSQAPSNMMSQHIENLSETTRTLIMFTAFVRDGPTRLYSNFPLPDEGDSFPCFVPGHSVEIGDSEMFMGEQLQITNVNHDSAHYRFTTTGMSYHVIYFEHVETGEVHYHRTVAEDGKPVMEHQGMINNLMSDSVYRAWAYALDTWGHVYRTQSVEFTTVPPPPQN